MKKVLIPIGLSLLFLGHGSITHAMGTPVLGDDSCKPGAPDCNVCAHNVEHQFRLAEKGEIHWETRRWQFNWNRRLGPSNLSPAHTISAATTIKVPSWYFPLKTEEIRVAHNHFQGFVRTNSKRFPYAASHSAKSKGSILFVGRSLRQSYQLSSIHLSDEKHPSGLHSIGRYVVYGERANNQTYLRFIDVERSPTAQERKIVIPKNGLAKPKDPQFGGGIGIAKLSENQYLILSTAPGGKKSGPRFNRFYRLKGDINQLSSANVEFLNESIYSQSPRWKGDYQFSENLSLITECGTKKLYAIHSSGEDIGGAVEGFFKPGDSVGKGYWRLSRVRRDRNGPTLQTINTVRRNQNFDRCFMRGAATVHVNRNHRLEFSCHEYARSTNSANDAFSFEVGIPHPLPKQQGAGSKTIPLYSWWSPTRRDNFATSDPNWSMDLSEVRWRDQGTHLSQQRSQHGYQMYRFEGNIFDPKSPRPAGTVPLYSWWNPSRTDNFATTDPRWSMNPSLIRWRDGGHHLANGRRQSNYSMYRLEGYLYDPKRPQPVGTMPVYSWWNPQTKDNFLTTDPRWSMDAKKVRWSQSGEHLFNGQKKGNYKMYRLEGYIPF
ncbi:hypothetical protein ACSYAD_19340 [Acaryochloris marina NIES-2412]|uniref:hypothetical protein n=1 Tax=Acaryochloris marina TaxID=155978 RepID=UPI004057CD49